MEDAGHEVAAEKAPQGAVGGGADVVSIAAVDVAGTERWWAVSEGGGLLDKGLVGEVTVGDEDGRLRAKVEGDDRAVGGAEAAEGGAEVQEGAVDIEEVAEEGKWGWAGWEVSIGFGGEVVVEEFEGDGKGDGEEEEIPCLH